MEAAFREGTALERQGKLDAEATARIDARLRAMSEELDRGIAARVATINAAQPRRPGTGPAEILVAILFLACVISLPLEFTIGRFFVFAHKDSYFAALPLLLAFAALVFAYGWWRIELRKHVLGHRHSSWRVRWFVAYPLVVGLSTIAVAMAPFGWAALVGWALTDRSVAKEATVLSIETRRESTRSGGCTQSARLDIDDIPANLCVQDRIAGRTPKPGDMVVVSGRGSALGFFVDELRVRQ